MNYSHNCIILFDKMAICKECKRDRVCKHQNYCFDCEAEGEKENPRSYYFVCIYCMFFGVKENSEEWDSWEEIAGRVADLTLMGVDDYLKGVKIVGEPKGKEYEIYLKGYQKLVGVVEFEERKRIEIDLEEWSEGEDEDQDQEEDVVEYSEYLEDEE